MIDPLYASLTPHELAAAGQALYGAAWRAPLAHALAVSETQVTAVERGREPAPRQWRARLIALAQDSALRALKTANDLLWSEVAAPTRGTLEAQPPRFA